MSKQYIISEDLINGLLQYLSTRPHGDVDAGVKGLQTLVELPDKSELRDE